MRFLYRAGFMASPVGVRRLFYQGEIRMKNLPEPITENDAKALTHMLTGVLLAVDALGRAWRGVNSDIQLADKARKAMDQLKAASDIMHADDD